MTVKESEKLLYDTLRRHFKTAAECKAAVKTLIKNSKITARKHEAGVPTESLLESVYTAANTLLKSFTR